jgi:hypothetical protein
VLRQKLVEQENFGTAGLSFNERQRVGAFWLWRSISRISAGTVSGIRQGKPRVLK